MAMQGLRVDAADLAAIECDPDVAGGADPLVLEDVGCSAGQWVPRAQAEICPSREVAVPTAQLEPVLKGERGEVGIGDEADGRLRSEQGPE